MSATAQANETPREEVRPAGPTTTRRFERTGVKGTIRIKQSVLPGGDRGGREVETYEGKNVVVRRTTVDGPLREDGTFVRTTRTLSLQQTPEARAKSEPAPWLRKAGDLTPRWSTRNIDALYSGKTLGVVYTNPSNVKVRLFAPYAKKVDLVLDSGERFAAVPDRSGIWEASTNRAAATLYGKSYHLEVDGTVVTDPYAQSTGGDYGPARFVDLTAYRWKDQGFKPKSNADVISEVHVRDMTAGASSPVDRKLRGSYAGMAGMPIVDHYDDLGISAVEMLPVHQYDHASGDNGTMNHWGYMTTQYFSPVRRYALHQDSAPEELMGMVDAYHQKGMKVVMDVVYNHTAKGAEIAFNVLGRSYYYRLQDDGEPYDGAGTGNEFASERPMARKLIIDSLRHFVEHYHVDGFRFDLGALLDVKTMRVIDRVLPPRVFLTSEPWAAQWPRARWGKGELRGSLADTRWSVWNDDFRNTVNRYMVGKEPVDRGDLMNVIAGSHYVPKQGDDDHDRGFVVRPDQSVNYLESHDELTVADRVDGDKNRALLGAVILLTSRGKPMLGHGQEFMRQKRDLVTRQPVSNAHNMDDDVSYIDWSLKQKNRDVFEVYKRLIALRQEAPQFHETSALHWILPEHDVRKTALGYDYPPPVKTGSPRPPHVAVFTNSGTEDAWFKLPKDGAWQVVVDGTFVGRDAGGRTTVSGYLRVRPGSAAVVTQ